MVLVGVTITLIEGIGFNDRAVWYLCLKGFNQLSRENIGTVPLTGVKFNRDLACDFMVHKVIELNQVLGINVTREVDLGARLISGLRR